MTFYLLEVAAAIFSAPHYSDFKLNCVFFFAENHWRVLHILMQFCTSKIQCQSRMVLMIFAMENFNRQTIATALMSALVFRRLLFSLVFHEIKNNRIFYALNAFARS